MEASLFLLFLLTFCSSIHSSLSTTTTDLITTNQFIIDGETIVSSSGTFELGFFNPSGSSNRYIGIWYKQILPYMQTVVWVANREKPLTNTSSVILKVTEPGILALLNDKNKIIWSTNTSRSVHNPVAVLLDSGNLVVKDANDDNPENFLWQSFNFPTDTHLPGMKIGKSFKTGHEFYLSSWKNDNDPAPGEFTRSIDPTGYPQILTKSGTNVLYRVGPWNGLKWSGAPIPLLQQSRLYRFQFAFNEEGIYYIFSLINHSSILSRMVMTSNGDIQRFVWVDQTKRWHIHYRLPADNCDTYSLCGVYGRCDIDNEPICGCLDKFVPKYPQQWAKGDWTTGCVRRTPLDCKREHVFIRYPGIKLPDTKHSQNNKTMTLEGCRQVCSTDCSCTAYSSLNISNGNKGCLLWFEELVDIRKMSDTGQDIFIKMDSSEQVTDLKNVESEAGSNRKKAKILAVSFSLLVATILLILILLWYKRKKKKLKLREDFELPLFPWSTITRATNNFSLNNKIGEGGFGPVYKGVLEEGQEIAVKRQSRTSMQGLDEYTNEVIYIAKLQHRNLVRLLGCCIQGEEKMLIYEYMPNNSLDSYIFDQTKNKLLDWPKRFHIINGIARGLLYLHQDSRLRIIHRDLKASNVLLDIEMNPKISDFGMARSVTGNEMGAKTRKVVGTHGYMSPEYAVDGIFSVKSDVFSFGVLVLEIVSGKKNRGFSHQDHNLNLLGHAWKLYKEDRSLELADEQLAYSYNISQVLRSIQVGLLCVQQHPNDRPSMFTVVQMLANESLLPKAKEPGFFTERNVYDEGKSGSQTRSSKNEVTITLLDPR
ncbi:G-type lectin S-receptor-like serine/threonine-protein kinase At4g27290 [Solanum tuberosum]|uniref:G-type lectin S-receptor-like serine/threonine-protein kinase At4g27290 n=1 Tax=Solanum tuberosum TaxID=4113 RepID=UPI00073A05B0|nr:PREDICTED: G-type lectin S-receptor-like serine/threonine-protein kinase At4g27290 [Solanum tuberosum]